MTQISDERLAELRVIYKITGQTFRRNSNQEGRQRAIDIAAALRELQQLRAYHREIICSRCGIREQLGQVAPAEF